MLCSPIIYVEIFIYIQKLSNNTHTIEKLTLKDTRSLVSRIRQVLKHNNCQSNNTIMLLQKINIYPYIPKYSTQFYAPNIETHMVVSQFSPTIFIIMLLASVVVFGKPRTQLNEPISVLIIDMYKGFNLIFTNYNIIHNAFTSFWCF